MFRHSITIRKVFCCIFISFPTPTYELFSQKPFALPMNVKNMDNTWCYPNCPLRLTISSTECFASSDKLASSQAFLLYPLRSISLQICFKICPFARFSWVCTTSPPFSSLSSTSSVNVSNVPILRLIKFSLFCRLIELNQRPQRIINEFNRRFRVAFSFVVIASHIFMEFLSWVSLFPSSSRSLSHVEDNDAVGSSIRSTMVLFRLSPPFYSFFADWLQIIAANSALVWSSSLSSSLNTWFTTDTLPSVRRHASLQE